MDMRNLVISLFIILVSVPTCSQSRNGGAYHIDGTYLNKDSGEVSLVYWDYTLDKRVALEALIIKGKFSFSGNISQPVNAGIGYNSFWIEPGNIQLTLDADSSEYISVKGSRTQAIQDSVNKRMLGVEYDARPAAYKQLISKYKDSYVAAELLFMIVYNQWCTPDEGDSILNALPPNIRKANPYIKVLITQQRNTLDEAKTPYWETEEFSPYWLGKGVKEISLNDFRGKVLLLDGWAYWCVPCREATKAFKPFYNENQSRGLEVVAINVDHSNNLYEWQKAIKADSTEAWHHVKYAPDLSNQNPIHSNAKDINHNYFIGAIPSQILIDRKGIVRGSWVGYSEETEKEMQSFILKLLDEKDK